VEGPFGRFTLVGAPRDPVFVAGGTGLAPILAMLNALAARAPHSRPRLIFGVTRDDDLFAGPALARLQERLPGLRVWTTVSAPAAGWDGERGTAIDLLGRDLGASGALGRPYYLCGPAAMVRAGRDLLQRAGVLPDEIHDEEFIATERS
jgi:methane monooxygenase component C